VIKVSVTSKDQKSRKRADNSYLFSGRKMNKESLKYWTDKIVREEKWELMFISDPVMALTANSNQTTFAHFAASAWESAAQKIMDDYNEATKDNVRMMGDKRILLARKTNVYGVSVKAIAESQLTPLEELLRGRLEFSR